MCAYRGGDYRGVRLYSKNMNDMWHIGSIINYTVPWLMVTSHQGILQRSVIPQAVDNLWKVVVNIKEVTFESLTWNIVLLGFSSKFACLYPVYVTNNYPNTNRI